MSKNVNVEQTVEDYFKDCISFSTDRLVLEPLATSDKDFMFELLNTEGWIKFIGNRNVSSLDAAVDYIHKIKSNRNASYWVVRLKEDKKPVGVITFIMRDYLDYPDLGFAFLPEYAGKGYGQEASLKLLSHVISNQKISTIYAITIPTNVRSISLLLKLNFSFEKEMELNKEWLHVYVRKNKL